MIEVREAHTDDEAQLYHDVHGRIFPGTGTLEGARGHGTMAGGRLHKPIEDDAQLETAFAALVERLLARVNPGATTYHPLVDD